MGVVYDVEVPGDDVREVRGIAFVSYAEIVCVVAPELAVLYEDVVAWKAGNVHALDCNVVVFAAQETVPHHHVRAVAEVEGVVVYHVGTDSFEVLYQHVLAVQQECGPSPGIGDCYVLDSEVLAVPEIEHVEGGTAETLPVVAGEDAGAADGDVIARSLNGSIHHSSGSEIEGLSGAQADDAGMVHARTERNDVIPLRNLTAGICEDYERGVSAVLFDCDAAGAVDGEADGPVGIPFYWEERGEHLHFFKGSPA